MPDVAIAHGHLESDGGAERVAFEASRALDAPIYAAHVDPDYPPSDVDVTEIETGRIERWVHSDRFTPDLVYWVTKHLYDAQRYSWVPELYEYDIVLVTKGDVGWFVPHADSQTYVRYFHSPPRRNYDQFRRRGESAVTRLWATMMRPLKYPQSNYPDLAIFNSEVTQRRGEMYWGVDRDDSRVVYPPVPVTDFSRELAPTQDYAVAVGRLAQNKRVGLLREVAERVDRPVVVAGDGPCADELAADAPPNLEYEGYVSEERKRELLAGARATLMLAENEDFGIVPIESFASGTPVIGVGEGFTRHQIVDGQNGVLVDPDVDSVVAGIRHVFEAGVAWSPAQMEAFARQFGRERFHTELRAAIDTARERASVESSIEVSVPQPEEVTADGGTGD